MRRTVLLLASMPLAVVLASGTVLAQEVQTHRIDSGPSGTINTNTVTFGFSSTHEARFGCFVSDHGTSPEYEDCGIGGPGETVYKTFTGVSEGSHSFWVYSYPTDSNVSPGSSSHARYFTVDTIGPAVAIDSGPTAQTNALNAEFMFSSPESGTSFQCKLDNGFFEPCLSPKGYSSLGLGQHTFYMRGTDSVDNLSETKTYTWEVMDTVRPSGKLVINGGRAATTSRTVKLRTTATDSAPASGVASMRLMNAGGSWTAWQPHATSRGWKLTRGAGKKTVYAQYRDAAGNVSAKASDSITYQP